MNTRQRLLVMFGLFVALAPPLHAAAAMQGDAAERAVRAIEQRMDKMEQRHQREMGELRRQIKELRAREDASAREAVEEEPSALPPPPPSVTPIERASAFNPAITVFGNFLGRTDDKRVTNESGDTISDRLRLREAELDFRAAVDPWADGVVIASLESGAAGNFDATIEEGYVILKKIPGTQVAPAGLKLKIGRFRPTFGRLNKIHTHDLPQPTRPRTLQTFLGEDGLIGDGADAEFFVPTPGDNNVLTAHLSIMNGGGTAVDAGNAGENPAYLAHLGWFFDLGGGQDLELGGSAYHAKADRAGRLDAGLYGLDLTYKWKPFHAGQWRSFIFGAELLAADIDQSGGGTVSPVGYYGWAQYQLGHNTYFGVRYDDTQSVTDADLNTQTFGAFLTYYTTEFLRLRLGLEHSKSDVAELDGLDTGLFELNFVFGSHAVEPYWVNQ